MGRLALPTCTFGSPLASPVGYEQRRKLYAAVRTTTQSTAGSLVGLVESAMVEDAMWVPACLRAHQNVEPNLFDQNLEGPVRVPVRARWLGLCKYFRGTTCLFVVVTPGNAVIPAGTSAGAPLDLAGACSLCRTSPEHRCSLWALNESVIDVRGEVWKCITFTS